MPVIEIKGRPNGDIVVYVRGLFVKPERTEEVRQRLAEAVGRMVDDVSGRLVEVFIVPFDPSGGFWSNQE